MPVLPPMLLLRKYQAFLNEPLAEATKKEKLTHAHTQTHRLRGREAESRL